jgi:RNA polymerase sigma-70 factor, ECF subfamily
VSDKEEIVTDKPISTIIHGGDRPYSALSLAFMKLWQAPHKWNPHKQTKFSTWFYKVIINLCLDFKKKRRELPIKEGMEFPAEQIDLDRILDQQVKAKQLEALIQALSPKQQIALNLSFYEGLSNKESAEIMEINIKALESLLMRAKTKLKSQIKDNKSCTTTN